MNATKAALKKVGWSYTYIDAQGDPGKEATGLTSLVNQKVDAIITIAVQPSAVQSGLIQAKKSKIPVINIAGVVAPSPYVAASYAPDENAMTAALNKYMIQKLGNSSSIATITAPSIYALNIRDQQLKKDLAGTSIQVVANHEIDFTNPVQDDAKAVTDILNSHPDVKAFWTDTDFDVQPTANVLKTKGLCGKVQVYGYYDDLANLAAIRQGCATAVVNTAIDASGPMAVDALLAYFVKHTPIPAKPPYSTNFFTPMIVDKSNVPATPNTYVKPATDFVAFFDARWKSAYGI